MDITECKHLELSQAANPNGRRDLKVVLHEIYPDKTQWNSNGITYLEKYTRDNAESVEDMPLCAEFLDMNDKSVPYGHGVTGMIDNMPVFEDSVQVGNFDDWSIEDIAFGDEIKRCLCAKGYVNEGRYPKFVKWLEDKIAKGETIFGSVEFVGTKENGGEIIYDGGWKEKGRIPMVYDYSGYCILSVTPSDSAAVLLELNQARQEKINKEEILVMNEEMSKTISEFKNEVLSAIVDHKNAELNEQIATLEESVKAKDEKIAELSNAVEAKDVEINELTEKVAEAEKAVTEKEEELTKQIGEINALCETYKTELEELKKQNRVAELNQALSVYSDEQKEYAKEEIEAFNADPFNVEINSITEKIDAASYRKLREEEDKKQKELEINSAKANFDDVLMASVDPILDDKKQVEDFDVFA